MQGEKRRERTGQGNGQRAVPDSVRELSEELRTLRARSDLTLEALAARTGVSRSSWERYLNCKQFPPRTAVLAFARAIKAKPERLLLLWDLAAATRQRAVEADGPRAVPQDPAPETGDATRAGGTHGTTAPADAPEEWRPKGLRRLPRGPVGLSFAGGALTALLLVGIAELVSGGIGSGDREPSKGAPKGSSEASSPRCVGFECRGRDPRAQRCADGAWTAAAAEVDGGYVELRYSPACHAAWARISHADVGDTARVQHLRGGHHASRAISYENDTYSPMVEAPYPGAVRACAFRGERKGTGAAQEPRRTCTEKGGATPVPYDPPRSASPSSATSSPGS